MNKATQRYIKVFPWFQGLTGDLLFYIAIDTLFLSLVKNFTAAEIVSLTSFSQLACIALQFPVLFVIKRIGNTASVRCGSLFLLLSAVLITFGRSYALVLVGRIFHDVAAIFKSASIVALENNLDLMDKREDFVRVRTQANTVYAVITMLISFVASYMFNMNNYLPMICCIGTCTVGFILSLLMKDTSGYNRISRKKKAAGVKINYNKVTIISLVLFALFYSIVTNGQNEGKLFIQQNVLDSFDKDATALIIGAIVCVSRIIRVISNIIFVKLYKKYGEKMGIALPVLLFTSIGLLLVGSFIPSVVLMILVMGVGYIIILFIRDPFKLYVQDVLFAATPKEQHQTLLTVMEFGVKVATAGIGLAFSAILLESPMVVIIAIMIAIALVGIALAVWLYRAIMSGRRDAQGA